MLVFFLCVCNFLDKILMVSDKTIHKAFRIHKTVYSIVLKPIRNLFSLSTKTMQLIRGKEMRFQVPIPSVKKHAIGPYSHLQVKARPV